jgi:hypothetical protein
VFTFLLVLFITLPDGAQHQFVADYSLSESDCVAAASQYVVQDATATWACVPDLVDNFELLPVERDYE